MAGKGLLQTSGLTKLETSSEYSALQKDTKYKCKEKKSGQPTISL